MDVNFNNLSIQINKNKSYLLHPITAHIPSGSICAILGGSGSGKTTLLSVIGNRHNSDGFNVHGNIEFINCKTGKKCVHKNVTHSNISYHKESVNIGFVTQQDFLIPFLTARETLLYVAQLRLPYHTHINRNDRMFMCNKQVDRIIEVLGLKECADGVFIGSSGATSANGHGKGLSGGEKRRVSVGIQMLSDPHVLCADEPTSGLDSFTALTVIHALRDLTTSKPEPIAGNNSNSNNDNSSGPNKPPITVICSIHQPRADIFDIFSSILLLSSGGRLIYSGNMGMSEMLRYFSGIGYPCPATSNPADYYVDLSCVDSRGSSSAHCGPTGRTGLTGLGCEVEDGMDGMGGIDRTEQTDRNRVKKLVRLAKKRMDEGCAYGSVGSSVDTTAGASSSTTASARADNAAQDLCITIKRDLILELGVDMDSEVPATVTAPVHSHIDNSTENNTDNANDATGISWNVSFISFYSEVYTLIHRNMTNNVRDKSNVMGCLIQALLSAVITVGIFYQIPGTLQGIQSRPGLVYPTSRGELYAIDHTGG